MTTRFEDWCRRSPEQVKELERDDPDHLRMMAEGWSWVVYVGGPKDGARAYFVGSPSWESCFCDASVDPLKYKPGDLEHRYVLGRGADGHAVYSYCGTFRRGEEV